MIVYQTCSSEKEARMQALSFALQNKLVSTDADGGSENAKYLKLTLKAWNWPVVMVPKQKFGHIVPSGGRYADGKSYRDEEDHLYGNFTSFPCVMVLDRNGNAAGYFAFEQGPDTCHTCSRFRSASPGDVFKRIHPASRPVPVCPLLGDYIGLHCGNCPERQAVFPTGKEDVEAFYRMAFPDLG